MVSTRRVACDGGGGALGHPKVWYDMGDDTSVECKYCDRLFVLDPAAASGEH
ncbi:zinc-finger domain-containing protein [bacterium]|nr:zinc-finger domain-containing protein [bacterium]